MTHTLKLLGFSNIIPADKMHMTLMYDKSNQPMPISIGQVKVTAKPLTVGLLGDAMVLWLSSPKAVGLHNQLKQLGFNHSFATFAPHLSLLYSPSQADINRLESVLPTIVAALPELTFTKINIEEAK
jgi:2'-5' RNA ligase